MVDLSKNGRADGGEQIPPSSAPSIIFSVETDTAERADACYERLKSLARNFGRQTGWKGVPFSYSRELGEYFDSEIAGKIEVKFDESCLDFWEERGLSLTCSDACLEISGTPKCECEDEIAFLMETVVPGESTDAPAREPITTTLRILPNPWELWKNIEPPTDAPYQTKHAPSLGRLEAGVEILAASLRGRSHAHEGKFRDDAFYVEIENDWFFFAVSDGAGSARYSREGARIACESTVKTLREKFREPNLYAKIVASFERLSNEAASSDKALRTADDSEDIIYKLFVQTLRAVCREIEAESQKRAELEGAEVTMDDYHATLLCGVLGKIAKNVWALATYWVGDGAFAVYRPNDEDRVLPLGTPDSGAYAGETRFFTERAEYKSEKIKPRVKMEFLRGFDAIILATDGVADPFFDSENALTQFEAWRDFYEGKLPYEILDGQDLSSSSGIFEAGTSEERAEKLLEWLNFQIPGNYDDRTLMIIRPQKPASFKERARKFAVEGARKLVAPVKAAGRCVQKSKAYMQELRKRGKK